MRLEFYHEMRFYHARNFTMLWEPIIFTWALCLLRKYYVLDIVKFGHSTMTFNIIRVLDFFHTLDTCNFTTDRVWLNIEHLYRPSCGNIYVCPSHGKIKFCICPIFYMSISCKILYIQSMVKFKTVPHHGKYQELANFLYVHLIVKFQS